MLNTAGAVGRWRGDSRPMSVTGRFIVVALFLCLACECNLLSTGWCGGIERQIRGFTADSAAQMGAVIVIAAFTGLLVAGRVYATRRFSGKDLWFSTLFAIALISYLLDYSNASHFPGIFIFFAGLLIAELVRQTTLVCDSPISWRLAVAATVLGAILVAAVFRTGAGPDYKYYGAIRWCGGWNSPNSCGLLMGVAVVLAWGLLKFFAAKNNCNKAIIWSLVLVLAATSVGLVATYSRGAWVATVIALIYWNISTYRRDALPLDRQMKTALIVGAVLVACVGAGLSINQREAAIIRRVVSPASAHDFSSRNRIAAWIAGLQLMGDHPLSGVGWNSPQTRYDEQYKAAEVQAATAIQTNDYIYVGAALGVPALFVFLMYVWTIVERSPKTMRKTEETGYPSGDGGLSYCLTAAAVVLAVGFAFDGGLFSLPTGTAFWVLANAGHNSN